MAITTEIAWTDSTWNPWIGCTKVSPGCLHCYAETLADKRRHWAVWGKGKPRKKTGTWGDPKKWNKSKPVGHRVFIASLADVFDDEVDPAWLGEVLDVIRECTNLRFLVLTKRIESAAARLSALIEARGGWERFQHLWLGCSAENQEYWDKRVPVLLSIKGVAKTFVSVEPMVGAIIPTGLPSWIIVGGESGTDCRPIQKEWVSTMRDYCTVNKIPFFFKQWGGVRPKKNGKSIDGREWVEVPEIPKEYEVRLYGKNKKSVPPNEKLYWTSITLWQAQRYHVTNKFPPATVNVTTQSSEWGRKLSPMMLGPVDCYLEKGKMVKAVSVEIAWQYSKVYIGENAGGEMKQLDPREKEWKRWRDENFNRPQFHWEHKDFEKYKAKVRRAFPKGSEVMGWYWDGMWMDRTTARRDIYAKLYCAAVRKTDEWKRLVDLHAEGDLCLYDIDGYDWRALGMTPYETLLDDHSWGHGLLLSLMLDGIDPTNLHPMVSFTKADLPFGWLGNMASSFPDGEKFNPIEWNGETFKTSEHLFQWMRFPNCKAAQKAIKGAVNGFVSKIEAKNYRKELILPLRDKTDLDRMRVCLVLKLKHNPKMIPMLLETTDVIVEDCTARPHDLEIDGSAVAVPYWGAIIRDSQIIGDNWLGKLWMEIRDELRAKGTVSAKFVTGQIITAP